MNREHLRLGDIVLVVPMRTPARVYYAKITKFGLDGKIEVRRWINARGGYNVRRQGEVSIPAPRFAATPKHVWPHEINGVVKREGKAS